MTRFLSAALQAPEPFFRLSLNRLEAANGHPSTDIRFSSQVQQAAKTKLLELGLDPRDTTPEELYHILQERVKADDARLTKTLRIKAAAHVSAEADVVSGMVHALNKFPDSKRCFAVKSSSLKALIKQIPPKKALKKLGYRSLESCLKHESPLLVMAAAWLSEGPPWQQRLHNLYKQLQPKDFEDRRLAIIKADFKRWPSLAEDIVAQEQHNLLSFKELGALVFLPLPKEVPPGAVTASLSLALHELNQIRASSTFLKLCQVQPDFGKQVFNVAVGEPRLSSQLLDKPVPWHLVHRYYSRLDHELNEPVFEPHLSLQDIAWHPIEQTLKKIEPSLKFWQHSSHLGVLGDRQPVSLNIVDAAINCCNKLPFEKRVTRYFQQAMWNELLLNYLRHEPVEQSVLAELQPQLATETALA